MINISIPDHLCPSDRFLQLHKPFLVLVPLHQHTRHLNPNRKLIHYIKLKIFGIDSSYCSRNQPLQMDLELKLDTFNKVEYIYQSINQDRALDLSSHWNNCNSTFQVIYLLVVTQQTRVCGITWQRIRPALGRLWVQFSAQTASQPETLKVVPTAAMSDARH